MTIESRSTPLPTTLEIRVTELTTNRRIVWVIVLALLGIGDALLLWRASTGPQTCELNYTFPVADCSQGAGAIVIVGALVVLAALVVGLWANLSPRVHVKLRRTGFIVLIVIGVLMFAISWLAFRLYGDLPF
jgi:hypothetical protein